jgi:hypothetical protein
MHRVTLEDKASRAAAMRTQVDSVAQAIVSDNSGDEIFERYLSLTRHVHNYSVRNKILISVQAPDSRLVASRTAFEKIAAGQGHEPHSFASRGGKCWQQYTITASGSRAIWIWSSPCVGRKSVEVTNPDTGEVGSEVETYSFYRPVPVYQVEDIRYADTGLPLEAPDFVQPVYDEGLYDALLAFASSKGIRLREEGLNGSRGVSKLQEIALQTGDPFSLKVAPLIHELAHELLHTAKDRVAAAFDEGQKKRLLEGEAEGVAAVVLGYLGHPIGISAAYLRNWKIEPADILASMQRIADAAGEIVEFVGAYGEGKANAEPQAAAGTQSPVEALCVAA